MGIGNMYSHSSLRRRHPVLDQDMVSQSCHHLMLIHQYMLRKIGIRPMFCEISTWHNIFVALHYDFGLVVLFDLWKCSFILLNFLIHVWSHPALSIWIDLVTNTRSLWVVWHDITLSCIRYQLEHTLELEESTRVLIWTWNK